MIYASRATIIAIYGAKFAENLTPVDLVDAAAAVDRALEQASAEIDGYLSVRYDLPLAQAPRSLERPCIDIAVYILANAHTRLTTTMEERYKQAIELLVRLGKGTAGLGDAEPEAAIESPTATPSGADFSANTRVFGRGRS